MPRGFTSHLRSLAFAAVSLALPASTIAQENIEFAPEDVLRGFPEHSLDVDPEDIVREILNEPDRAKEDAYYGFGDYDMAEALRVLAGWSGSSDARRAYERLWDWQVEFFADADVSRRNAFASSIVSLAGDGTAQVRADLVTVVLGAMQRLGAMRGEKAAPMLQGAGYLSELIMGPEGANMIFLLQASAECHQVRPIIAHILIYNTHSYGASAVGDMLGHASYRVARRFKGGDIFGPEIFGPEEDAKVVWAEAVQLGRTATNIESAIQDWAQQQKAEGGPTAAHGARIVNATLSAIDVLTGGLSSSATAPVRAGVRLLEEYETALEEPPEDPTATIRQALSQALEAPFIDLIHDDVALTAEERSVLAETLRKHVSEGRNSSCKL